MNGLFDAIVTLFEYICQLTGLRYAELNILVYCLLIPLTWAMIVAFRNRKHLMLPVLHIISIYFFLSFRGELNIESRRLYEKNVVWLEFFGKNMSEGYVYISLIIGLLVPILMYALLLFLPKQKIGWIYFFFLIGLGAYQAFVYLYT